MIKEVHVRLIGNDKLNDKIKGVQEENKLPDSSFVGMSWRNLNSVSLMFSIDDTEELTVLKVKTKHNKVIIEFKSSKPIYERYKLGLLVDRAEQNFEIYESEVREDGLIQYKAIETGYYMCKSKKFDTRSLMGLKLEVIEDIERIREIERESCRM